jgi:hypothetical protein
MKIWDLSHIIEGADDIRKSVKSMSTYLNYQEIL